MASITTSFGKGGTLVTDSANDNVATALRDIADDLATVKSTVIATANATDLATAITLVNAIKTYLNAIAGTTLKTLKV